jgi:hypothetical protein
MAATTTSGARDSDSNIIGTSRLAEVDDLLNAHHFAAARGSLEDFFGCFHSQGTYLGTDATENWKVSEFVSFCRPYFDREKGGWTYTPIAGTRKIVYLPDIDTATFATFDECMMSADFKVKTRGTGSLIRLSDAVDSSQKYWLILSYHLSFDIPNDLAKDVCSQIERFGNTRSLVSRQAAADAAASELLADLAKEKSKPKSKKKK